MGSLKRSLANNILTSGKFDATDLTGNLPSSNITNASMTSITAFPASAGSAIVSVASDPPSPTAGDVWYNTTTNKFKYAATATVADGSWSSGGSLNSGRENAGGFGTQTAAVIAAGGELLGYTLNAELYNGSSWTEVNNLTTGRTASFGLGVQTSGLIAGGYVPGAPTGTANTETWDGTNWTEVNNLNTSRYGGGASGTSTAGLVFAGFTGAFPGGPVKFNESWDGTSWTEITDMNTGGYQMAGFGIQTATLAAYVTPAAIGTGEIYDGTSWTGIPNYNTYRYRINGSGTTTAGLIFLGYNTAAVANTESYDGSAWTEVNDLSTARFYGATGSSSPNTASIAYGGQLNPSLVPGSIVSATEEWTAPNIVNKSVTTA